MTDVEQTADARKEPKVIKRYTNRKLYDTVESRYVTLDEISEMIKAGSEVRIVDNRSKEDLTSVTLAQIIFEEEKKRSKMPLGMLRDIIRHSGETLSGFLQTQVGQAGQKLASIKEEAEVLRDRILRREESARAAAAAAGEPDPSDPSVVPQGKPNAIDQAKEMVAQSQRAVEDWQKRLDERVRQAVENVTSLAALAKDLASLEKRIAELEKRLDDAESK
ncbi:MAG: polyhydroxyalkanoate synthesis regulator DNA-binding domain-containing protein [Myxococcales bacterium]